VVTVDQQFGPDDWPRRPDGDIDFEAIPERRLGSGRVIRHQDGSAEYVGVPRWQLDAVPTLLHHARCETIKSLGDHYSRHCAEREELGELMRVFESQDVPRCPVCF
jgi:hypothetical protein